MFYNVSVSGTSKIKQPCLSSSTVTVIPPHLCFTIHDLNQVFTRGPNSAITRKAATSAKGQGGGGGSRGGGFTYSPQIIWKQWTSYCSVIYWTCLARSSCYKCLHTSRRLHLPLEVPTVGLLRLCYIKRYVEAAKIRDGQGATNYIQSIS